MANSRDGHAFGHCLWDVQIGSRKGRSNTQYKTQDNRRQQIGRRKAQDLILARIPNLKRQALFWSGRAVPSHRLEIVRRAGELAQRTFGYVRPKPMKRQRPIIHALFDKGKSHQVFNRGDDGKLL